MPHQVEQRRKNRQVVPGPGRPGQQRHRHGKCLPQRLHHDGRPGTPRMPVTRQPPHVSREHRVDRARPAELPACRLADPSRDLERLGIIRPDLVISADVDHHARSIRQPGEENPTLLLFPWVGS
jgi:hypothetical protein